MRTLTCSCKLGRRIYSTQTRAKKEEMMHEKRDIGRRSRSPPTRRGSWQSAVLSALYCREGEEIVSGQPEKEDHPQRGCCDRDQSTCLCQFTHNIEESGYLPAVYFTRPETLKHHCLLSYVARTHRYTILCSGLTFACEPRL